MTRTQQGGVTLVELLISIVIGLVMIGALLGLFSGSTGAGRAAEAQAQMNEDAQYALRLLSNQARQSGYNPIQPGRVTLNPLPFGIFACDNGFSNAVGGTAVTSASLLSCNAAASANGGAIAFAFEADQYNTPPAAGTTIPTDCLGNQLTQLPAEAEAGSTPYYIAENRFYVANNNLFCAGNGGGVTAFTPQPMVENIERVSFSYGVADPAPAATGRTVTGYLTSAEIGPSNGVVAPTNAQLAVLATPDLRWGRVVSVRICVTVRSARPVLTEPQIYFACDPEVNDVPILATDNFMRKNYSVTVALRNRIALP
ncbi:MAG TPA: PilW family protein [Rhodoferax sp.]|nr:PilW family protein [Rhodoferax sp.]